MNPTMSIFTILLSLTISISVFPSPIIAIDSPKIDSDLSAMASNANAASDLITEACANAPKKDLCQLTISVDAKTPKNDINDLAFLHFEAASTKTLSNIEYITRSTADPEPGDAEGDASLKQVFLDCEQEYEGAVDDVDNSINYLASRTKEDDKHIDGLLQDAINSIDACQKKVTGKGPKAEQLAKLNQELLDMLHNAKAVFDVIKL